MKNYIAVVAAALVCLGLVSTTAWAGPARRHTLEGFALGAGAVLLGTVIIHNISKPAPVIVHHPRPHRHKNPEPGYWKTEQVWIPGETETRWNPGHYAEDGQWIQGRYQAFEISPGHWETRKVWVSSRGRY